MTLARSREPNARGAAFVVRSRSLGRRVAHLADLGYLARNESAELGVLRDNALVLRETDAEGLVGGDVAFEPLDVRTELAQHFMGHPINRRD